MPVAESRRLVPRVVAAGALLLVYAYARLPSAPEGLDMLARRFRFESAPLPAVTAAERTIRPVRKSLEHIDAWISAVGAGVALHDIDGDGLSNDALYVDTRSDEVVVAPVPGTKQRYAPFDLLRAHGCSARAATAPMGVLPADVDENGLADAIVYFWGRSPLLFVRTAGPVAVDAFVCREIVAPSEEWYTNAATLADVDGDGHADLIIGNYFRERSGVLDTTSTSREMQMQDSMSRALNGGVNRILLWTRDGYRESRDGFPAEIARAWTLAIGAQDLNGDLLPEIYFANDFGPDRLLYNISSPGRPRFELVRGKRHFLDPSSKVLGRDSFKGMGVDFADVNGDVVPDIFVTNIADDFALEESNFLFVSNGRGGYRDASEHLGVSRGGWGWDARFGDFDNDGQPELLQATGFVRGSVDRWPELHELAMTNDDLLRRSGAWPRFRDGSDLSGDNRNPFFTRATDGRWYDVAEKIGIPASTISRGIATADVDGDGRLDFAVANQWQTSQFFRNVAPANGNALVLYLRHARETALLSGPPRIAASPAIGANARVVIPGRTLVAQVDGGNGHSGKRGAELHFGLGKATRAEVELSWRDRNGRIARHQLHLTPGVWTVLLGEVQR